MTHLFTSVLLIIRPSVWRKMSYPRFISPIASFPLSAKSFEGEGLAAISRGTESAELWYAHYAAHAAFIEEGQLNAADFEAFFHVEQVSGD